MEALEFARELKRMCHSHKDCTGCSLCSVTNNNLCNVACLEKAVPIVEKWSAEHPLVRNVDWVADQLEKIGYRVDKDRLRRMCPVSISNVFFTGNCTLTRSCGECQKWWLEEHREEKKE